MLSRTADHLFWMARYTERAENTARMLDVRVQYSLMPQSSVAAQQGWRTMLSVSELERQFDAKYPALTQKEVIDFMVRDPDNPSSIASCLAGARENARAVRGTLPTEVWETENTTWIELQQHLKSRMFEHQPGQFLEWVKHRSHLSRGVTLGTMFQDGAFNFIRLGTFLERADNTARILDVKFRSLDSDAIKAGPQGEFYYLAALLRSVSAFETYRKVYRDAITPARVATLLILEAKMPRSLVACMAAVVANLREISNDVSHETERLAGKLHARLQHAVIDDILAEGLHDFLTSFLVSIEQIGNGIGSDFLVPAASEDAA
ncbi:alpha-E domain-containing protein [Pseudoduganella umbonata]|uniref:Alpha-E domain-containing protein n=1 Tax=Pseudoduganella umbonata TaxID=864828 RepID=A0A4P8HUI3_9BURK|nr:alpha-E domain-containing protein [Pseudoduganella umbonata]MBB3223461.1 putative alpha-E superfamily protein [Pseudoduganella umbonata]QCP13649.1 alpha-E domain-containing protein [Pseudoduganella umbonata]